MKWMLGLGTFLMATAWGDPQSDLLASFLTLRNAVQDSLSFAHQQCDAGKQKQCQHALIDTALLGTLDAEIALNRLRMSALSNLDDAESDITHASAALEQ